MDLPEPVAPVTSSKPWGCCTQSRSTEGAPVSAKAGMGEGIARHTEDQPRCCANTLTRKRPRSGTDSAVSWSWLCGFVLFLSVGAEDECGQSGNALASSVCMLSALTGAASSACNCPSRRTMGGRPALKCKSEAPKWRVCESHSSKSGIMRGGCLLQLAT